MGDDEGVEVGTKISWGTIVSALIALLTAVYALGVQREQITALQRDVLAQQQTVAGLVAGLDGRYVHNDVLSVQLSDIQRQLEKINRKLGL